MSEAPPDGLSREELRALVRECATVVAPGETLIIRLSEGWPARQVEDYQECASAVTEPLGFRVLVVVGEQLAVTRAQPEEEPGSGGGHVHNRWSCPAHVEGCGCPVLEGTTCNPYHRAGYCPDDIERMP